MRARGEAGQLLPLYALVVLVACGALVLVAHLGQLAHRRAQARTAADAAALAGVAGGRDEADRVADANGAVLEGFVSNDGEVTVRVQVGGTHAIARAQRDQGCRQSDQPDRVHSQTCQPSNRG